MNRKQDLHQLQRLGQMILDSRLTALNAATRERQDSLDQLTNLARPAPPSDLPELSAKLAELSYQRWAEARRRELNLSLARQTAAWLDCRQAAQTAFGRSLALRHLVENVRK